jgi:hypothetical protein
LARARDFSLLHSVQIGSGAHPTSYPKETEVLPWGYSSRGVKPTTYLQLVPRSRMVEIYLSSWHSASFIKHRDNFTFTLPRVVVLNLGVMSFGQLHTSNKYSKMKNNKND